MRNSARYLLLCSVWLLTGMRDPFRPPDDPCAVADLAQWHYRGMVDGRSRVGLLLDGKKSWHRLKTQERLPMGWQVMAIEETALVVEVGEACEPKHWTWQREGTNKNEITDNAISTGAQQPAGRSAKAGHVDGG